MVIFHILTYNGQGVQGGPVKISVLKIKEHYWLWDVDSTLLANKGIKDPPPAYVYDNGSIKCKHRQKMASQHIVLPR